MQKLVARASLPVVALFGAICLIGFARFASPVGQKLGAAAAGIVEAEEAAPDEILHQELLAIYAPKALIDFTKSREVAGIETNDDLARLIEEAGLRDCWMVTLGRSHMKRAGIIDMPVITRPGQFDYQFRINRAFLQTLAGTPPSEFHANARIVVIPEHLLTEDPHEALKELLER